MCVCVPTISTTNSSSQSPSIQFIPGILFFNIMRVCGFSFSLHFSARPPICLAVPANSTSRRTKLKRLCTVIISIIRLSKVNMPLVLYLNTHRSFSFCCCCCCILSIRNQIRNVSICSFTLSFLAHFSVRFVHSVSCALWMGIAACGNSKWLIEER